MAKNYVRKNIEVEYGFILGNDSPVQHDRMTVYAVNAKEARRKARRILAEWGIRSLYEVVDPAIA